MGYGYSLLPTASNATSTMTLRLTPAEKRERDEWIVGADKNGIAVNEIAYEVGLSIQRVKQILKAKKAFVKDRETRPRVRRVPHNGYGCGKIQEKVCPCGRIVETVCYDKDCSIELQKKYEVPCLSIPNFHCSSACWSFYNML